MLKSLDNENNIKLDLNWEALLPLTFIDFLNRFMNSSDGAWDDTKMVIGGSQLYVIL